MEPRRPSTASTLTLINNSSIRRRSSTHRHTTLNDLELEPESTIVLRPLHAPLPSPPLPSLPIFDARLEETATVTRVTLHDPPPVFIPIPLTPRPDPSRTPSSDSASYISRLPTPPFPESRPSSPHARPSFPFLPKGLSFLSFRRIPLLSYSLSTSGPPSTRSNSASTYFHSYHSKKPSIHSTDTGYQSLIPSIGTIKNFTQKWPEPRARLPLSLAKILEDGKGLGMERVERWTKFKWCLLISVCILFAYSAGGLVCAILTWFRAWDHADVMYVADNDILILLTLASSILLFTALLGFTGTLLNSRPILAIYTLLLWPGLISILAIGYTAYKRRTFALDHKLNLAWSQWYTSLGHEIIQDSLKCCGYYSALHQATPSRGRCYSRTPLPGCKGRLYRFEKALLSCIWRWAFGVAGVHLGNVLVSLLCAGHVTERFGKGIAPRKYWLRAGDVRCDAEKIWKDKVGRGGQGATTRRPQRARAGESGVFREDRRWVGDDV